MVMTALQCHPCSPDVAGGLAQLRCQTKLACQRVHRRSKAQTTIQLARCSSEERPPHILTEEESKRTEPSAAEKASLSDSLGFPCDCITVRLLPVFDNTTAAPSNADGHSFGDAYSLNRTQASLQGFGVTNTTGPLGIEVTEESQVAKVKQLEVLARSQQRQILEHQEALARLHAMVRETQEAQV